MTHDAIVQRLINIYGMPVRPNPYACLDEMRAAIERTEVDKLNAAIDEGRETWISFPTPAEVLIVAKRQKTLDTLIADLRNVSIEAKFMGPKLASAVKSLGHQKQKVAQ